MSADRTFHEGNDCPLPKNSDDMLVSREQLLGMLVVILLFVLATVLTYL